jgi:hypothetical protein
MFSTLAVTGAPRKGLPASSVTTPEMLPSEAAATVPFGKTPNHNARPKFAITDSKIQTFRFCLVIEILLNFSYRRIIVFGTRISCARRTESGALAWRSAEA